MQQVAFNPNYGVGATAPISSLNNQVTNSKTLENVDNEIKIKQAEVKVLYLQDVIAAPDTSKEDRIVLQEMLRNAQVEFAALKNGYAVK